MRSDLELEPERRAQNQRYSVGFLNVCQHSFSIPVSSPSYSCHTFLRKLTCAGGSQAIYERAPYLKKVLHAGNDARRL